MGQTLTHLPQRMHVWLGVLYGGLLVRQGQQAVGALHHGGGEVVLGVSIMGPPISRRWGGVLKPPGHLDEVLQRGPDGSKNVEGPGHGAAGQGDVTVGEGLALGHSVIDGGGSGHVEHGAAHVGRQGRREAPPAR